MNQLSDLIKLHVDTRIFFNCVRCDVLFTLKIKTIITVLSFETTALIGEGYHYMLQCYFVCLITILTGAMLGQILIALIIL